jgi:putative ABC transport system ATP-binding protein
MFSSESHVSRILISEQGGEVTADAEKELAVRCRGITKHYGTGPGQVTALRGVDLEVYRGELLMIVGPSGCGKTTLLSIISAILDRDTGQCDVLGHDLASLGPDERARFRGDSIGFVFQVFNLLPALTARENVAIPLLIQGKPRKSAIEHAQLLLHSVGLASRADAFPGELSGGEQQRVAIARALIHNPALIVCDEPTGSLDHRTGHGMMALLRGVARNQARTLIVVTHDNRILGFADRIARMDDGKIMEIGTGRAGARWL